MIQKDFEIIWEMIYFYIYICWLNKGTNFSSAEELTWDSRDYSKL